MAKMAILSCRQMIHGCILAGRKLPVVTTGATRANAGVIKHPGSKTADDMTHRTIVSGGNMIHRFTDRRGAVMAGSAVIYDPGMIEHRR
jgi:hypothetical protein